MLTRDQDGRPTGEAFVEVPSEAAQQRALTLHRARMGQRYIEIFVASKPDMQQAVARNRQVARAGEPGGLRRRAPLLPLPLPSAPGGIQPDGATLKLRGLPYSAGIDDITSWLAGAAGADGVTAVRAQYPAVTDSTSDVFRTAWTAADAWRAFMVQVLSWRTTA